MKKEEAIETIKDICLTTEQLTRVEKALGCLLSAPFLPSNLDEAAYEYFLKTYGIDNIAISEDIKRAVNFGAEWMAEQGITLECLIDYKSGVLIGIDSVPTQETLKDYCNKIGASRVLVQIRKK